MTVNYCGSCGAANGAKARFCRQCGTDLDAQADKTGAAQPPTETAPPTGKGPGNLTTPAARPQLRIVSAPGNKSSGNLPANEPAGVGNSAALPAATPQPTEPRRDRRAALENLRRQREAQIIEQQQEEDARQIKQTVASSLSQRLAHTTANQPAAGQAATPAAQAPAPRPVTEQTPTGNSGALAANPAPRVRTAPLPPNAPRSSGALTPAGAPSGKLSLPSSAAVAVASGLREHPQAGLFLRAAAAALTVLLLSSGVYFYRNQKALSAGAPSSGRNLLSPEDQSEQLIQNAERARQGGQFDAATADLSKAIELTPEQPVPRQLLAETYAGAGRADEALQAYDNLVKLTPDNLGARLKLAEIHRAKGNVNEARQQYQRIIALNQASPEATRALDAIEEIDDLTAQTTAGNRPANTRPRRVAGRKTLGPVLPPNLLARNQVALIPQNPLAAPGASALLDFNPLRPLEVPDPKVVAGHHKELGTRFLNIGQFNAALKELHEAVRLTPADKDLYYLLGSAYKGLNQPVKAFEYYKKCDAGPYAATAQTGAKQVEKSARKEFDRQQKELEKAKTVQSKQAEGRKDAVPGKGFQNSFQEQ